MAVLGWQKKEGDVKGVRDEPLLYIQIVTRIINCNICPDCCLTFMSLATQTHPPFSAILNSPS